MSLATFERTNSTILCQSSVIGLKFLVSPRTKIMVARDCESPVYRQCPDCTCTAGRNSGHWHRCRPPDTLVHRIANRAPIDQDWSAQHQDCPWKTRLSRLQSSLD